MTINEFLEYIWLFGRQLEYIFVLHAFNRGGR